MKCRTPHTKSRSGVKGLTEIPLEDGAEPGQKGPCYYIHGGRVFQEMKGCVHVRTRHADPGRQQINSGHHSLDSSGFQWTPTHC